MPLRTGRAKHLYVGHAGPDRPRPCHAERAHGAVARPCAPGARSISTLAGQARPAAPLSCWARPRSFGMPLRTGRAKHLYVGRTGLTGRVCPRRLCPAAVETLRRAASRATAQALWPGSGW